MGKIYLHTFLFTIIVNAETTPLAWMNSYKQNAIKQVNKKKTILTAKVFLRYAVSVTALLKPQSHPSGSFV